MPAISWQSLTFLVRQTSTCALCIFCKLLPLWGFAGGSDRRVSAAVQETHFPSLGPEDPLEKGMTTHSRILAWKISWTEEPGWLQSIGSQGVRLTLSLSPTLGWCGETGWLCRGPSVPLWASYCSGDRGLAGGLAWVTSRPRTRAHRPCSSILSKPCHLPLWENQDCPGSILDSMLKRSKDIGPLSVSFFSSSSFPSLNLRMNSFHL